jgi:serine/threonine protein kinase
MCSGRLPFEDPDVHKMLEKIVRCEPTYPTSFSPALVGLLQKMICKDPATRITVNDVKSHPWFSQTGYWALLSQNGNTESRRAIDPEIIGKMMALGIDCHELRQSLLQDEFTDLTALYRILIREKICERNKDLLTRLPGTTFGMKPAMGMAPVPTRPTGRGQIVVPALSPSPVAGTRPGQKVPGPVGGTTAGRRLSRPQAVRRPVERSPVQGTGGHETL